MKTFKNLFPEFVIERLGCVICMLLLLGNSIIAQNLVSHDFDNGDLGPFEVCTTQNPNYTKVVNNRIKTFWTSDGYDGSRSDKGAEACADQWYTYKEGWYGMNLEIGPDYPKDTKAGIAQIFGFVPGFWSWEAMLQIDDGDLTVVHRPNGGTSQNTEEVVYANFPYEQTIPIIIHFVLSQQNQGEFEIWVDGVSRYKKTNINFGFGDFDNNDTKIGDATEDFGSEEAGSLTVLKLGQYNFTDSEYKTNETRTVYYDDVTWYNGSNGYNVVNPNTDDTTTGEDNLVHMRKRNATGFAIDGNNGGANGQNVYLWSSNSNNNNQLWNEIDRGNGYYSYQKYGTNYCLDGNNGGENGQSVYLWECKDNNQNQHWEKVDMGSGTYKLIKRNASGYALDGGSGGADGQNVALYNSSSNSQNLQWVFTSVKSAPLDLTEKEEATIGLYPVPFNDVLNITLDKDVTSGKIEIINTTGKIVFSDAISNKSSETLNLSHLSRGLYIVKITSVDQVTIGRVIKE